MHTEQGPRRAKGVLSALSIFYFLLFLHAFAPRPPTSLAHQTPAPTPPPSPCFPYRRGSPDFHVLRDAIKIPQSDSKSVSPRFPLPPPLPTFIHLLAPFFAPPRLPSHRASQASLSSWHYKLTFATTKTARALSASACPVCKNTLTQTHNGAWTRYYKMQQCQQEHQRGRAGRQNEKALFLFQLRVKLKSSPCSPRGPPFCACLTPPVLRVAP